MDGTARTLASQYDSGSRRSVLWDMGISYSGAYSYDPAGRLTRYDEGMNALAFRPGYDTLGRRTSIAFGVGNTVSAVSYGYDPIGRLATLGHDLAGTSADQSLGFTYNPASQIAARIASNDAYRSTSAYAVNRPYVVNGLNQYTQAGPASFTYDLNGNLTSDGSTNFVYDAENRLVSASGAHEARHKDRQQSIARRCHREGGVARYGGNDQQRPSLVNKVEVLLGHDKPDAGSLISFLLMHPSARALDSFDSDALSAHGGRV